MSKIEAVRANVEIGKTKLVPTLVQEALDEGSSAMDILQAMVDGMGVVGDKFSAGEIFVPEMLIAAKAGDKISLGFVVETERQVEHHLNSHMDRLPAGDQSSRAIVAQMRDDEVQHADAAERAGGVPLPKAVQGLMRLAAKVMTTVAHRI